MNLKEDAVLSCVQGNYAVHSTQEKNIHLGYFLLLQNAFCLVRSLILPLFGKWV